MKIHTVSKTTERVLEKGKQIILLLDMSIGREYLKYHTHHIFSY